MRWLVLLLVGCSPPTYPTPGGLDVELFDGAESFDGPELDRLYRAVDDCIPDYLQCRTDPPRVRISGKERVETPNRQEVYGYALHNAVVIAAGWRGMRAFPHELVHYLACEPAHGELTETCGDATK